MKRFSIFQNLSKLRKIPLTVFIALLVFGIPLSLSGCRLIKSAELRALEDTASVLQLTTGQEVSRSLQDKGTALGKPIYAKIYIEYEPINNYTKEDVYHEIIAALERNGWKGKEASTLAREFSASYSASLKEVNVALLVDVRIYLNRNLVSVRMTNRNR
jgi:hypothetical protein